MRLLKRTLLIAVLSLCGQAVAAPAETGLPKQASGDRVLFTYSGKPVTCKGLTLLTWRAVQRRIVNLSRFVRRPPGGKWPSQQVLTSSPLVNYQPRPGASVAEALNGDCHAYLQAAFESYLVNKVIVQYGNEHSFPTRKYFRLRQLPKYDLLWDIAGDAYNQVYAQCAELHWNVVQFAAALKNTLPGERALGFRKWAATGLPYVRRNPLRMISPILFPSVVGGRIAPWCDPPPAFLSLGLSIHAKIKAHRKAYSLIVAKLYGTTGFVIVRHMMPQDAGYIQRTILSCTGPGAKINTIHLGLIQLWLWMLGSPTRIDVGYGGNYTAFHGYTGIPIRAIRASTFLPLKNRPGCFLYIYQRRPSVSKALLHARPGDFLWDVGVRELFQPICREVLARTKPKVPWLKIPKLADLLRCSSSTTGGPPPTSCFGFPLPQLVRKKYRNAKFW